MSVTSSADLEIKDPAAILDYSLDWSDWLGSDVISTSTWSVPAGLTLEDSQADAQATTIWVSGGTNGVAYACRNTVVTAAGRTNVRTLTVTVGTR
jgi:hypothetical protein